MKSALVAALAVFVLSSSAYASVLYTQSPDLANTGDFSETQDGVIVYDNFSLNGASTITNVAWTGADLNTPSNSFTISFYSTSTASDIPGTLLSSSTVTAAGTDEGKVPKSPYEQYSYDADITPFLAAAGTQYFISIASTSDPSVANFTWTPSLPGSGDDYSLVGINGLYAPIIGDEAFTLNGSAILTTSATPEPSSLVLAGSGILSLAGAIRRRMKK